MNIASMGLGKVGRRNAAPSYQAGYKLTLRMTRPSAAFEELASPSGLASNERAGGWLHNADLSLSCVAGTTTPPVLAHALSQLSWNAPVADFTTTSPKVKREGAALAAAAGIPYVDNAILGAISLNLVPTPLPASGNGSEELEEVFERAGARVQPSPYTASALDRSPLQLAEPTVDEALSWLLTSAPAR
ncbi:NAD(P)-binding domain-containing protein [Variovorax rhizosphaerae]|uniref:NAD(P)-binding domain-containing protein n=1 Tax=Variovorax rhizosphaerae TaxID=1836200 RepID=A0ABU8WRB8_9BURK